jgi:signal transduction histidine kinase/putative methionine-R-sulfoxide reductase with GAF domain
MACTQMIPSNEPSYGFMVVQDGRIVFADAQVAQMCQEEAQALLGAELASKFHPQDWLRVRQAMQDAARSEQPALVPGICPRAWEETIGCVDLLATQALFRGEPALHLLWIDRRSERQRQQEAEVMRDVMAALASAGDLQQTLEALLVNLHGLIHYDRAGLFLVDENERIVLADRAAEGTAMIHLEENPLVAEMRRDRRPVIVADVQADERFADWPDFQSVRGWLGAPLLAGQEMLGFISLGALEPDIYTPEDAEKMQMFASQVSQVLERVWASEQSHRRTEELEVLSTISFALGQAESGGVERSGSNALRAILEHIARFFEASRGALLSPDPSGARLVVRASLDERLIGLTHPDRRSVASDLTLLAQRQEDDVLLNTMRAGQPLVISDVEEFLQRGAAEIFRALLDEGGSAVLVPLRTGETVFGLLCLVFDARRRFTPRSLRLFDAVAEIAGASLRRAVVLEALEKQVAIRTQHLSTLYRVNAVASEPLQLYALLDRVLEITLEAMKSNAGVIHFLDEPGRALRLSAQRGLTDEAVSALEALPLEDDFWDNLMRSTTPLVLPDLTDDPSLPPELAEVDHQIGRAYIGVPLRAKGQALGALSLFGETILDYTIEDITLFMTIADQIGGLVERARLAQQAEAAAVVQERQRLARELHDSVTQLLYSQVLFSGASLKVLRQGNLPLAEQHLARIEQAAQQALKEMRLLVYELRPSNDLDEGLARALQRRLEAVEKRSGIEVRLVVQGEAHLDPPTIAALYRIAEEALNNTLKHAHASAVQVTLRAEDGQFTLEIADNGRGFDLSEIPKGGMGLVNMRERAAALGGQLELSSRLGQGTRVAVRINCRTRSDHSIEVAG